VLYRHGLIAAYSQALQGQQSILKDRHKPGRSVDTAAGFHSVVSVATFEAQSPIHH
jgi:hypothetical protein